MKLNRTPKIIVAILTALVVLSPLLFIFFVFAFVFLTISGGQEPNPVVIAAFFLIFPLIMLISFTQFGLMIFYITHIVKNHSAADLPLILLAVGIYFMPYFAMPAYFLIYILPETPPDWALAPTIT